VRDRLLTFNPAGNFNRIGAGLFPDAHPDHGLVIYGNHPSYITERVFNIGYIPYADRASVNPGNDRFTDLVYGFKLSECSYIKLCKAVFYIASGQGVVFRCNSVLNIVGG
jgi:hypothetical protein